MTEFLAHATVEGRLQVTGDEHAERPAQPPDAGTAWLGRGRKWIADCACVRNVADRIGNSRGPPLHGELVLLSRGEPGKRTDHLGFQKVRRLLWIVRQVLVPR